MSRLTREYWYPVLLSKQLGRKPVRVDLDPEPVVLFRTRDGVACLRDICPHRLASLSRGRIVGDTIECPYHGWRFDRSGACASIPHLERKEQARFTQRYDAREEDGLIFIARDAARAEPIVPPTWDNQPKTRAWLHGDYRSTLEDSVENVLDPVHTLYVHPGVFREAAGRAIDVTVEIADGLLTADFHGDAGQDNFMSRLFEGPRTGSRSTFRLPGMVELQYSGPRGLTFVATIHFTRLRGGLIRGLAIITGRDHPLVGRLAAFMFRRVMEKVLAQDIAILEDIARNMAIPGIDIRRAQSPLDVFRAGIEAIAAGAGAAPAQTVRMII